MLGLAVNVGLRAAMLAMLAEVLRARPDDPRFAGKGIAVRFAAAGLPATMLVPALWLGRGRREPYPFWVDSLYVSLFALDLAGNVLDLYDRHKHFDLVPHTHGGGAIAVTAAALLGWPAGKAAGASIAGHALLEAQEYASDVVFGLRNVRGWRDVVGDLGSGMVGAFVYAAAYERYVRYVRDGAPRERAGRPPDGTGERP